MYINIIKKKIKHNDTKPNTKIKQTLFFNGPFLPFSLSNGYFSLSLSRFLFLSLKNNTF